MNRYGRYRKCKVCKNVKSQNPEVSFHSFPQNPEKRNIWFALLGFDKYQEIPKWSYICSDHFNKNDFQYRKNGKKYLKSDSNPSLVQPEIFQPQLTGSRSNIGTEPSIVGDQSQKKSSLEEEDSKVDVPDVMSVDQLTPIDEATVKIEIKEEPSKVENDLLTSDIHEEPLLPFIKEEPSDEQGRITLETIEQLDESERESIQIFFDSMARTVMTLSPSFVRRIKLEVLRVVTDMEMEAHKENMEQSKEPRRKPNNATAISKEPEPNIKIEIEDDADTEALNVPDEPESSHPDHDTNLEPSRKKMKKSEAEQPTSSSSALMVDKTPRSQHETFFQSIAYTVTSFPPPFAFKTKMAVLKVVSKMQVEACRSRQNCCQDGEGKAYDSTKRPLLVSGSDY